MGRVSRLSRRRGVGFAFGAGLAVLCGFLALAISMSERGDAAFPGLNGKIAYGYGDGYQTAIWSANADGSSPAPLTAGTSDYSPSYSANGSRIAFGRENSVMVMNADGSGLTQLLGGTRSNSVDTKWQANYKTPGGKIIPFVKIQTFSEVWHAFTSPAFSPDGTQLAVGDNSGKFISTSICAVEEEEDLECLEYSNPDSYFDFDSSCLSCVSHIITISSTTGALSGEVTPPSSVNEDYEPTYSAGGQLAFARWSSSGSGIFVVGAPGAAPVQVTTGPSDYAPDFSPDGSRIVFNRGSRELGLVGAGGGPVTLLTIPNPPGATSTFMRNPAFSPDGTRITFDRSVYGPTGKIESGIFTMGADGSAPTRIVNDGFNPSWQPVPPPPPPAKAAKAKAKKGKIKLNRKNRAVIGKITCGSSACALKVLSSKLKAGKTKCSAKAKLAKKLAPGKSTNVGVKVVGKCLAALKKAGKGSLVTKIRITDALGKKVVTMKATLVPASGKKGSKKGKGGK